MCNIGVVNTKLMQFLLADYSGILDNAMVSKDKTQNIQGLHSAGISHGISQISGPFAVWNNNTVKKFKLLIKETKDVLQKLLLWIPQAIDRSFVCCGSNKATKDNLLYLFMIPKTGRINRVKGKKCQFIRFQNPIDTSIFKFTQFI